MEDAKGQPTSENASRLHGRRALVTGASRGFGRAMAGVLANAGAEVWGTSRAPDDCEWPAGVTPLRFDVSSPDAVQRSWDEAGLEDLGITIVVNNAGSGVLSSFCETEFTDWEQQIGLMLLGPMKLSHLAVRQWSVAKPGILVNVTSLATEFPIPYMSGYNAAKSGLSGFTESLLQEVDEKRVQVLELRLGDLNTDFNGSVIRRGDSPRLEKVWQAMRRHTQAAPGPEKVAERVLEAMLKGRRGIVREGGFFQTVIASLYGRFVSQRVKGASNLAYYS